jgi:hypothetical protein
MAPDHKLSFFEAREFDDDHIEKLRKLVVDCWKKNYAPPDLPEAIQDKGKTVIFYYILF